MKVSVITLHHVRNFGSMLQTYATQQVLIKQGCDSEIINFIPNGLRLIEGIHTIRKTGNFFKDLIRKCVAYITFSDRQLVMLRFMRKHICLSEKTYYSYEELQGNPPLSEIYLSGSDQIWNTQNKNNAQDIQAYYLNFGARSTRRISYASSIGKTTFENKERQMVKKWLSNYSSISVRENQAVKLLGQIGIQHVKHVLDPTLLLTETQWVDFFSKYGKKRHAIKPYIFVYNLNRNSEIKKTAALLEKERNLKIVNFADTLDFIKGANNRLHNTAYDFLYFLWNAEIILTDSFHGTAFSINFSKQFVAYSAPKYNSRIESILELFNLESRLVVDKEDAFKVVEKKIDYSEVKIALEKERAKSNEYLRRALYNETENSKI